MTHIFLYTCSVSKYYTHSFFSDLIPPRGVLLPTSNTNEKSTPSDASSFYMEVRGVLKCPLNCSEVHSSMTPLVVHFNAVLPPLRADEPSGGSPPVPLQVQNKRHPLGCPLFCMEVRGVEPRYIKIWMYLHPSLTVWKNPTHRDGIPPLQLGHNHADWTHYKDKNSLQR